MKQRIILAASYPLFWIAVFLSLKAVQTLYHFDIFSTFSVPEILNIFLNGFILDLSVTAYLSVIPFLLLSFSGILSASATRRSLQVYTCFCLLAVCLVFIVDLELFRWWGFRIDKTILKYLNVPGEMFATASVAPVYLLSFILIASLTFWSWVYHCFIDRKAKWLQKTTVYFPLLFLPAAGLLIIPIRGGLQQIPVNQSAVYFSEKNILNQAAVNPAWNFFSSIIATNSRVKKPYSYAEIESPERLLERIYTSDNKVPSVLRKKDPNVLIILWESLTSKVISDPRNLTPNFNSLLKEGLFFKNIYASGDRSEKGIAATLSGFPSQPTTSIMKDAAKAGKLPGIAAILNKKGYHSSFYYGGELEFANLKSYLFSTGFSNLVGRGDFPSELDISKWGIHDEFLFNRLLLELGDAKEPFFTTAFTLSSHEPYDVPMSPRIEIRSNQDRFCHSICYTDKCLGDFIEKAKKSKWWDNTLIIIIADHGHVFPGKEQWATHLPSEFSIPMLWLGGALTKKDTVVEVTGSQTDLPVTLLSQMGYSEPEKFPYSRNLLRPGAPDFAWYSFNNGFALMRRNTGFVYDNTGNNFILKKGEITEEDVFLGKAYQQVIFRDYVDK